MDDTNKKIDPIRDRYFRPLQKAESAADWLFYIAAAFSIAVVLVDRNTYSGAYEAIQTAFLIVTVTGAILGLGIRLYWSPRAQRKRADDFFSEGFDVPLTHERTKRYYNNNQTEPFRRLGFQLLENTLFSKAIALRMCKSERTRTAVFGAIWLLLVTLRSTSIDLIVAISLALFGEQLIVRIARLEWLRMKFEAIHDSTYRLLQSKTSDRFFQAEVSTNIVAYENAKANAAITMSSEIFDELNPSLSGEWEAVKEKLQQ